MATCGYCGEHAEARKDIIHGSKCRLRKIKVIGAEEFKRVILEIGECLKHGGLTPTFQRLLEMYEKEIE